MHHIQKYILRTLMYTKKARFTDMRPPKVDSNAYSYHLRVLIKRGLVEKIDSLYRLSPEGLFYVDKVSMDNLEPRIQPKIITMIVITDDANNVLMFPKTKQPFIQAYMLPFGKVHLDDLTVFEAASREVIEKVGVEPSKLKHVGDCYIHAKINGHLVWNVLAHVMTAKINKSKVDAPNYKWLSTAERKSYKLLPATEQIIDAVLKSKTFFFDNFEVDW